MLPAVELVRAELTPADLAAALGLPAPTPEQAAVIAAPLEPALVVAGAGSGKTETMAARVVWLVAIGAVRPEQVLGLTFTRKAAQQLGERVRARLRRLAGSRLLDELDPGGRRRAAVLAGEPTVSTYHAYAGRLVAEHALRLPAEPGVRLLSETAAWQLAHRVVTTWTEDLDLDWAPATVSARVLELAGQLGEHLVGAEAVRAHAERLCTQIRQAGGTRGPASTVREVLDAQRLRVALLPLGAEFARRKAAERAMDFADQMAMAARLAAEHPEVGAAERAVFRAVLLDEYQDTGHAQRVLLRALFGGGPDPVPVTAVGDPCQSIYGWRGASAANLSRFATDFPRAGVRPAARYGLLTSFRNPPEVLAVANACSTPLRAGPGEVDAVPIDELRARDGAPHGEVRVALLSDVGAEVDWVADAVAARWHATLDAGDPPPTAAVLLRRRADMAPIAAALRARDVPVEVVGLGGLLDEPEVADLVAALRLVADPLAGTAAVRLLTGARWRLGAADLAALWRRARELAGQQPGTDPEERAEQAGLVDALDDPGAPARYSEAGYARIRYLADELTALRRRTSAPLPDLVADVERALLLDVETVARPGPVGRAHLDAFADVVTDFAAGAEVPTLSALLDYLAAAADTEDGLEPGEVEVAQDRVQVLTVHAAKGLEWQVVVVPHLVDRVFPATKKAGSWLRSATELPAELRGDALDLPRLDLADCTDRTAVTAALEDHEAAFDERRLTEERRLLYVALTRSQRTVLLSGHWWARTGARPRGPSPFLVEVAERVRTEPGLGVVEPWTAEPDPGAANPAGDRARTAGWPVDPLGPRRAGVARGAAMVLEALSADGEQDGLDPEGWAADADLLLAELAAGCAAEAVVLPAHLSVSQLVELARDPAALARRLRRPLPYPPNPHARRGTAFHVWLEERFGARRLLDLDELPGAADAGAAPDAALAELQEAFLGSRWAARTPVEVEVPFETEVDGVLLRGRMDAVFADPDGGFTVVDWKTGQLPEPDVLAGLSVQLAAYRLAWAALSGSPLERVRAAFHYVRPDVTLSPAGLLGAEGVRALVAAVPLDPTRSAPTGPGGAPSSSAAPASQDRRRQDRRRLDRRMRR